MDDLDTLVLKETAGVAAGAVAGVVFEVVVGMVDEVVDKEAVGMEDKMDSVLVLVVFEEAEDKVAADLVLDNCSGNYYSKVADSGVENLVDKVVGIAGKESSEDKVVDNC